MRSVGEQSERKERAKRKVGIGGALAVDGFGQVGEDFDAVFGVAELRELECDFAGDIGVGLPGDAESFFPIAAEFGFVDGADIADGDHVRGVEDVAEFANHGGDFVCEATFFGAARVVVTHGGVGGPDEDDNDDGEEQRKGWQGRAPFVGMG